MDKNKVKQYNITMALYWPLTVKSTSWLVNVITGIDDEAIISEHELHGMVEYAKNFYKKWFETDNTLSDEKKEAFKHNCEQDLSLIAEIIKQFGLEEVSPSKYRYKSSNTPSYPIPDWFRYVVENNEGNS